jgi:hypothetical protein
LRANARKRVGGAPPLAAVFGLRAAPLRGLAGVARLTARGNGAPDGALRRFTLPTLATTLRALGGSRSLIRLAPFDVADE